MPKRVLTGTVVSEKGEKTIVVRVERRVKHPLYGKIIKLSKKYHAHDAANEFHVGEVVRIEECAPISKLKTWKVVDRIDDDTRNRPGEACQGIEGQGQGESRRRRRSGRLRRFERIRVEP